MAISIGIDSFSYHRFFGDITDFDQPTDVRWTTEQVLQTAADLGVSSVSLQTTYLPQLDDAYIDDLRAKFAAHDLTPVLAWGHSPGFDGGKAAHRLPEVLQTLDAAKRLGCTLVRVVGGNPKSWRTPAADRTAKLLPLYRDIVAHAAALDLDVAVENHADYNTADLVELVEKVGADNFGICFDTLNAVRMGDDLLAATKLAAPHIMMVHIKDLITLPESVGTPDKFWPSAPLGHGEHDVAGFVNILRDAGFDGCIYVETGYMHPNYPDEVAAVEESVAYLKNLLHQ